MSAEPKHEVRVKPYSYRARPVNALYRDDGFTGYAAGAA